MGYGRISQSIRSLYSKYKLVQMITLGIDDIVNKVRVKLDEIGVNESEMSMESEDNRNLDTVIKSCIPGAYNMVSLLADASILEGVQIEQNSLTINDDLVGIIMVPDNAIRILSVRLSSWIAACQDMVSDDSQEYKMQANKWIRANGNRPVAALVQGASGRQLELYRAKSKEDTLLYCTYLPGINESDSEVNISTRAMESFIYFVAALTMVTFKEEIADDLFKVARSLLGIE